MERETPKIGDTVYYYGKPFLVKARVAGVGFMLDNEKNTIILMKDHRIPWETETLIQENE